MSDGDARSVRLPCGGRLSYVTLGVVEHVPNSGHDLSLEQPLLTASAILAFTRAQAVNDRRR